MRSIPPLFPSFAIRTAKENIDKNLYFFNFGRTAFKFLANYLNEKFNKKIVFLIPAYTCPSILISLEELKINLDFVDLDNNLDFKLDDLNNNIAKYSEYKVAIVATSLFGIRCRDYKKLYPNHIVIEDKSQSNYSDYINSDFQIYSFGKGKFISSWNGGALRCKEFNPEIEKAYSITEVKDDFLYSYFLSILQLIFSKYFYFFIRLLRFENLILKQPINNYKTPHIFRISDRKIYWILNSIKKFKMNSSIRRNSIYYDENIKKELKFNISFDCQLLRYPVKCRTDRTLIFNNIDYWTTYNSAVKKRSLDFDVPFMLLTECTFLPTHELVKPMTIKSLTRIINEKSL